MNERCIRRYCIQAPLLVAVCALIACALVTPPTPTRTRQQATVQTVPGATATRSPTRSPTTLPSVGTSPTPTPTFTRSPGPALRVAWKRTGLTDAVQALAVSPAYANDHTLFAGGDGKVWKSTDGGNSWKASTLAAGAVNALAVSPDLSADHTVFAAVFGSGLYKSTDGGDMWTRVNENNEIHSLAMSPNYAKDKTVFFGATATWNSGAYRSQDGGSSWVRISNGLHNVFVFSLAVSPNYANDRMLFAGTNGFLFESTNSGDSWEQVLSSTPPPVLHLVGAITSMAVSPNFGNNGVAFAGTDQEVYRRGRGWGSYKITFGPVLSLAVSPQYTTDRALFAGSDGKGVWMSNDEGKTWVTINDGLSSLNVESLAVTSEPILAIFAATAQGVYKTTARP